MEEAGEDRDPQSRVRPGRRSGTEVSERCGCGGNGSVRSGHSEMFTTETLPSLILFLNV